MIFFKPAKPSRCTLEILNIGKMENYFEYLNSNLNIPNRNEMKDNIGNAISHTIMPIINELGLNNALKEFLNYDFECKEKINEILEIKQNLKYEQQWKEFAEKMISLKNSTDLLVEERKNLTKKIDILSEKLRLTPEAFENWKKADNEDVNKFSENIKNYSKEISILYKDIKELSKKIKLYSPDIIQAINNNFSFIYKDDTIIINNKKTKETHKIYLKNWELYFDNEKLCKVKPYKKEESNVITVAPLPHYLIEKSEKNTHENLTMYRKRRLNEQWNGWLENKNKRVR